AADDSHDRRRREERATRGDAVQDRGDVRGRGRHDDRHPDDSPPAGDDDLHGRRGAVHRARDPAADLPDEPASPLSGSRMPPKVARRRAHGIFPAMRRAAKESAESGFTLIEILVVVFIIGLLATIVSVNVIGQTDTARVTKAKADLKEIEQALHLFKLDNGFYPTTEQGLRALVQKPTSAPQPRKYNQDGYIGKLPEDPWMNPYVYL